MKLQFKCQMTKSGSQQVLLSVGHCRTKTGKCAPNFRTFSEVLAGSIQGLQELEGQSKLQK